LLSDQIIIVQVENQSRIPTFPAFGYSLFVWKIPRMFSTEGIHQFYDGP